MTRRVLRLQWTVPCEFCGDIIRTDSAPMNSHKDKINELVQLAIIEHTPECPDQPARIE